MIFNSDIFRVNAVAASLRCSIDRHIGVTCDRHISACTGAIVIVDSSSITAITITGYIDRELTAAAAVCGDGNVATVSGYQNTTISVDGNGVVADQLDGQVLLRSSAERDLSTAVVVQRQYAGGFIICGVVIACVAGEAAGRIAVFEI